jgi:hypothetical protein
MKKIAALALCLVMLAFAACGSAGTTADQQTTTLLVLEEEYRAAAAAQDALKTIDLAGAKAALEEKFGAASEWKANGEAAAQLKELEAKRDAYLQKAVGTFERLAREGYKDSAERLQQIALEFLEKGDCLNQAADAVRTVWNLLPGERDPLAETKKHLLALLTEENRAVLQDYLLQQIKSGVEGFPAKEIVESIGSESFQAKVRAEFEKQKAANEQALKAAGAQLARGLEDGSLKQKAQSAYDAAEAKVKEAAGQLVQLLP